MILIQLVIISIATLGLHEITQEGLIGYPVRKLYERLISSTKCLGHPLHLVHSLLVFLESPLMSCPTCMASIWGTVGWFYMGGDIYLWPVAVFSLAFLNTFFYRLLQRL